MLRGAFLFLCGSCGAYVLPSQAPTVSRAAQTRVSSLQALEPATLAAASFAAGFFPPSLLLVKKDSEVQEANAQRDSALAEVERMRGAFEVLLEAVELETDVSDAELDSLLQQGQLKAAERREELENLKVSYEAKVKSLKDLLGDYTDKLELQQNRLKRSKDVELRARSEAAAVQQRAKVLERRLEAANKQIDVMTKDLEELRNPFAGLTNLFAR